MSQRKVEEYKKEKANRRGELEKQKRKSLLVKICGVIVCVAVVGIIAYALYNNAIKNSDGTDAHTVDLESVNEYLDGLEMDTAMAEFSEDTTQEAVSDEASGADDKTEAPSQTEGAQE